MKSVLTENNKEIKDNNDNANYKRSNSNRNIVKNKVNRINKHLTFHGVLI